MTENGGKLNNCGPDDYPAPIVSGDVVKYFYECFTRWSQQQETISKQKTQQEPRVPVKEFIEESKASFKNRDFSKDSVMRLLGGKLHWKKSFAAIATLIDCYEHVTEDRPGFHPLLPFSCRNSFLLDNIGCRDSAWRVINNAMKVGLIACVDDQYWFPWHDEDHPLNGRKGKCRLYAWNKTAQRELKKLAKQEGILTEPKSLGLKKLYELAKEQESKRSQTPTEREKFLLDRVRIDTGLRIPKEYTDEEITAAILRKYPLISETVKLVKETINPLIDRPDQRFMANVHITRSPKGMVTKIGFRPAPHYVSLRKDPTAINCSGGLKTKRAYLDDHFGPGHWQEWDVKSSVPRLLYALNHDLTWLPCSQVDMYEMIASPEIKQDPIKWANTYRDQLKKLFLRVNFNYSYKTTFNQLNRCGALSEFIPNTSRETAKSVIRGIKDTLLQALGPTCGSEIFVLESFVYLKAYATILKDCKSRGLPVPLLFYDGFVTHKACGFNFETLIAKEVRELKSRSKSLGLFNEVKHNQLGDSFSFNPTAGTAISLTNMSGYGNDGAYLMVMGPENDEEVTEMKATSPPVLGSMNGKVTEKEKSQAAG